MNMFFLGWGDSETITRPSQAPDGEALRPFLVAQELPFFLDVQPDLSQLKEVPAEGVDGVAMAGWRCGVGCLAKYLSTTMYHLFFFLKVKGDLFTVVWFS